jgi:hypothetical protein
MASLLSDARGAGWTVASDADGTVRVTRRVGRWEKTVGLVIHADGTAIRLDVHPSVATGIRSYATMRTVLGLTIR